MILAAVVSIVILVSVLALFVWGDRFLHLKQWQRLAIAVPIAAFCFGGLWYANSKLPDTELRAAHWKRAPITVDLGSYAEAGTTAVELLNGMIDCKEPVLKIVEKDADITVEGIVDIPCNKMDYVGLDDDDFGGAYYCGERGEIHITKPGDTWQQAFIIYHELGHQLGLPDGARGAMAGLPDIDIGGAVPAIVLSHKDVEAVRRRFCVKPPNV